MMILNLVATIDLFSFAIHVSVHIRLTINQFDRCGPMLGKYYILKMICPGYQLRYQKWHLSNIIGGGIRGVGYHPLWYLTRWYPKIMLIFGLNMRSKVEYQVSN